MGSGITQTKNETKDIMKVIKSLENRGVLLIRTTRKITSSEGAFLNFVRTFIEAILSSMKNLLTPIAKSVLIIFLLTVAASPTDAVNLKKILGSGTAQLIISNEKMEDITKIVKSLEESSFLIKGVGEKIKNEPRKRWIYLNVIRYISC